MKCLMSKIIYHVSRSEYLILSLGQTFTNLFYQKCSQIMFVLSYPISRQMQSLYSIYHLYSLPFFLCFVSAFYCSINFGKCRSLHDTHHIPVNWRNNFCLFAACGVYPFTI